MVIYPIEPLNIEVMGEYNEVLLPLLLVGEIEDAELAPHNNHPPAAPPQVVAAPPAAAAHRPSHLSEPDDDSCVDRDGELL